MGDATIQAAIQTLLQASARFEDDHVTLGDFQVIGKGKKKHYAVITPGPFRSERSGDWSQVNYSWTCYVEVWDPFEGDDLSAITATRQAAIDQINKYPTLNGTAGISNCVASASGELMFLWRKGQSKDSKPGFAGFRIAVSVDEEILYSGGGEFAA